MRAMIPDSHIMLHATRLLIKRNGYVSDQVEVNWDAIEMTN